MHDYKSIPGQHIGDTARGLCALAAQLNRRVTAEFNDITLAADVGTDPDTVVSAYRAEMTRQREAANAERRAREQTPDGQEATRKAEERRQHVEAEVAKGILPFEKRDQALWEKCLENNTDGYGACINRFAARWANYMEAAMADGAEVRTVAKEASRKADIEGITGFMYGAAVSTLSSVWKHGEELRRWHNLDTQIGNEGEKANESGGTLNPAVLSIGGE